MKDDKDIPTFDETVRIIIRDPLGFGTGIIIDNVSFHICPSDQSVRIYGMMRAVEGSAADYPEPEIYYYFLDKSSNVIHAGSGMHFGSFHINRFAPFEITIANDSSHLIWDKAERIVLFASY